ncbi:MAG TPA: serine hydrolase domain-containing protein [Blastocatellia bacterium]|nr:serine hydrolase domain-containing protein [Blastocatellia bacterium]
MKANGNIVRGRLFTSVCAALLLVSALAAARANGVDEFVQKQMEARHIPGVSVAVVQDGKVVLAKGYGMANVELSSPATENTVYQLASVTKQFTATAIMMLVEDGKISLDDKLTKILDGLPAAWDGVTVRHLLNHTSGIRSYTSVPDFFKTARKDYKKEEIIKLVTDAPMEFAPGEKWNYNNTGYFLLGMIIEKVSGKEYGAFLSERIFQPLGMTSTRVNDLTEVIKNRAQGYTWNNGRLRNGEYLSPTQPFSAGALVSTVLDLAKWDAALYTEKLLRRASLDQMWTPTKLNDGKTQDYGFGWGVDVYRTRKRLSHGGGIQGFSTFITRFVDDKLTVIVLVNQEGGAAAALANGIAEFYIPALKENAPKPVADSDPKTTQFLKEVITSLAGGTGDPNWFTQEAQKFFFPNRIKEGKQMLGALGALKSFELMEETVRDKNKVRGYKAVFGTTAMRCNFMLAEDGKIAGIGIRPE